MSDTSATTCDDVGHGQPARRGVREDNAGPAQFSAGPMLFVSEANDGAGALAERRHADIADNESNIPADEPFDQEYLISFADEGIDLKTFRASWCHAMHDDLERLDRLHCQGDLAPVAGLLHRLSGAVCLVGAQRLTEALRNASGLPSESHIHSLGALIARARSLLNQLKTAPIACRNMKL